LNSKIKNFKKEFIVKSSTENLSLIRDFAKSVAEAGGFDEEATGKIILAIDEACTNIIKHAYKYSPEGEMIINANFNGEKLIISITDEGSRFDPNLVPEPDIKEYHKQRRVGGLGIYLMKKLMDEVEYKIINDRKNQVILVKYVN
jgi:serine/threonine-protein kinase RsbW